MDGNDRVRDPGKLPLAREPEGNGLRQSTAGYFRHQAGGLPAPIRREQLGYLARGSVLGFIIHPIAAAVVALTLFGHADHQVIVAWLMAEWGVAGLRAVYWQRHRSRRDVASAPDAAFLTMMPAVSSLLWGAAPLLIWPEHATGPQMLLIVAIAAVMAVEMVTLASSMLAVFTSLSALLLALLFGLSWHGVLAPLMMWAIVLYASVIGIGTYYVNRLLFDSLRLRFELAKSSAAAQAASKAKSDFIANMSHELRTPLNAIIGFAEIIKLQVMGDKPGRYVEYAADIHRSGIHLLEIINDILDLSKIEAGRLELRDERVDLGSVIKSSLILINDRANESGVEVASSVPTPAPVIRGDERSIKQILLNLLSNAVKFTPIGGRILIDVFLDATGGIVLTVKDTGIGMSPADIPKAMQPFGQLGDVHTRNRSGTGLGLPIVKSLVEMHDAEFRLTSELGVGSAAEISFPARRVVGA